MNRKIALSLTAAAFIWLIGSMLSRPVRAQDGQQPPIIILDPPPTPAPPQCQPCHIFFPVKWGKIPANAKHRK